MMTVLSKYIIRTILKSSAIVALMLSILYFIFTFLAELKNIGEGDYGAWQAIEYVLLSLPGDVGSAWPMIALMGSMMGLGLLSHHCELIAMRAAGVSVFQIAKAVCQAGLVLALLGFISVGFMGPKLMQIAVVHRSEALTGQAVLMASDAVWVKQKDDFLWIGHAQSAQHLENIQRFVVVNHALTEIDHINKADYENNQWQLTDIHIQQLGKNSIVQQHLDSTTWKGIITPDLLNVLLSKTGNLTLKNLFSYVKYQKKTGLNTSQFEFDFWQMIFQPIATLILTLFALPFMFGPSRSSKNALRLTLGVIVGFGFFMVEQFFGPFSTVYGFSPFWAALLPVLIFGGFLSAGLFRMNR